MVLSLEEYVKTDSDMLFRNSVSPFCVTIRTVQQHITILVDMWKIII